MTIVFNNANSLEVNEAEGQIIIEIDPIASGITEVTELEISTIDGNARSTDFTNNGEGLDFTALNSFVLEVNPNNSDTFTFPINITEDAIAEQEENFQFRVRGIDDASLNGAGTITILDDDNIVESVSETEIVEELLPSISIDDVQQLEGNSGITNFEFTVSLDRASEELVTVDYATANGTADITDYIANSGAIAFTPGETEQTITVEVISDTESLQAETELETFFVNLSNQTNASLSDFRGVGTIINDDFIEELENSSLPIVRSNSATFVEGNAPENNQQLVVNLVDNDGEAVLATQDISFTYSTIDITAAANLDYEFIAAQTAIIESGESNTAIDITIIGDEEIESQESFAVALTNLNPELARFDNARSELETLITIIDDDSLAENQEVDSDEIEEILEELNEEEINSDDTEEEEIETELNDAESDDVENEDLEAEETENGDSESDDIELEDAQNVDLEESESVSQLESDVDREAENEEVDLEDDINRNENTSSGAVVNEINGSASQVNNDDSGDADNTILRFLNTDTGGYLYTALEAEQPLHSSQDFELETASFVGVDRNAENAEDIYRFRNTRTEGYFYTASETERDFVRDNLDEFIFEDVAFSAFETNVNNSIPVYRFFDDNTGVHFYTADETERTFVEDNLLNYNSEGIAFYALPVAEII